MATASFFKRFVLNAKEAKALAKELSRKTKEPSVPRIDLDKEHARCRKEIDLFLSTLSKNSSKPKKAKK